MSIAEHLPTVRPIKDREEFNALVEAAKEDNHTVLFPTHVLRKNGEIVGYFMLGQFTSVWLHSKKVLAKDTFQILVALDTLAAQSGLARYIMICLPESPFYGNLSQFGFNTDLGMASFAMKEL